MSALRLAAFASPGLVTGLTGAAVVGILPTIYATHYGVKLGFIGLVLLLARILDAVLDPVIGYVSDHTVGAFGRRRTWIVIGAAILTVASFALLRPPAAPSDAYVLAAYLAFFFAWAMIEIPHTAWSAELSRDARERTRVMTYKTLMASFGSIALALAPIVLGGGKPSEMTPSVLATLGLGLAVATPILTWACVSAVQDPPLPPHSRLRSPLTILNDVRRNKPFLNFIRSFLIAGLGYGMYGGLYFLYIQTYLKIGDAISLILIVMTLSTFVGLPIWMRIIPVIGKRMSWAIGLTLIAATSLGMVFIQPGPHAKYWFVGLLTVMGIFAGTNTVVPYALLADIVDYDTLKSGQKRSGSYFSILMLIVKVNLAAGAALGFIILQAAGYNPAAVTHSDTSVLVLKGCTFGLPSVLMAISAIWVARFPIGERQHRIIKRRLDQRADREARDAGTVVGVG